ncbi:hypothetical protein KUTeg_014518 [Tegillarca granosa]|uniref:Uncharacterized protein n=1 Tax=Tegillarca granosa TaxID=220873 RepID=A0ABQ9ERT4_TEGGR|nr:hypothetical protein KUTeg_014518 [Tegillarca granosa]
MEGDFSGLDTGAFIRLFRLAFGTIRVEMDMKNILPEDLANKLARFSAEAKPQQKKSQVRRKGKF